MNMKFISVVTPAYIYRGCSTQKMFWEEKFTLSELTPVNMKISGRQNVGKHREITNGEKYTTFNISLKFSSLDKIKITSSSSKYI